MGKNKHSQVMREMKMDRRAFMAKAGVASGFLFPMFFRMRAGAAGLAPLRFFYMNNGNGSHPHWTPTMNGSNIAMGWPMRDLDSCKNDILWIKDLTYRCVHYTNSHREGVISTLTGSPVDQGSSPNVPKTASFDYFMAKNLTGKTPIRNLVLATRIDFNIAGIGPEAGAVSYEPSGNLTKQVPAIQNPLQAYDQLVRPLTSATTATTGGQSATQLLVRRKSVLDAIALEEIPRMRQVLGASEKTEMDGYLQSLREAEASLTNIVTQTTPSAVCSKTNVYQPKASGSGDWWYESKNMGLVTEQFLKLVQAAFACDLTRVVTLMVGGAGVNDNFGFAGINAGFHGCSHFKSEIDTGLGKNFGDIINWHAKMFGSLIKGLKAIPEAGNNVLYNSMLLWGTNLSNSNHSKSTTGFGGYLIEPFRQGWVYSPNTPFILAGQGGGKIKTGRIISANKSHQNDLFVSLGRIAGMNINTFGDPSWNKTPVPIG